MKTKEHLNPNSMRKKFILVISLIILFGGILTAGEYNQLGISLKSSTNGLGGDLYYRPAKMFAFKAGFEYAGISMTADKLKSYGINTLSVPVPMPDGSEMIFDVGAKLRTGALSLAVGFQPFGGLYLTAGVGKFLFGADVTGAPTSDLSFGSQTVPGAGTVEPKIAKDKLGVFSISARPSNALAPYFGIGIGSFVPRKRTVSFAFELGAYYLGSYVVNASMPQGFKSQNVDYGTNMTQAQKDMYFHEVNAQIDEVSTELNNNVNTAVNDLNNTIKPFGFYPVVKMTIGIKAFDFNK